MTTVQVVDHGATATVTITGPVGDPIVRTARQTAIGWWVLDGDPQSWQHPDLDALAAYFESHPLPAEGGCP